MEQSRGRGRGRGFGRGRGYQPRQDFPSNRRRYQNNRVQRNNQDFFANGHIPPLTDSCNRSLNASQDEETINSLPHESLEAPFSKQRTYHPEELGIKLKNKSAVTPFLPRKPEKPGTLGKRIKLISNCFPIEIPSGYVYHYDIEIKKRNVNVQSEENGDHSKPESKTTTDDHAHSESKSKIRIDDSRKLESEIKTNTSDFSKSESVSDDQIDSDSEGKPITGNHKKYRCLNTKTNRKVFSLMVETLEIFNDLYPAYDGKKNFYTKKELPITFTTGDNDKLKPFKCEIVLDNENPNDSSDSSEKIRRDVYEIALKPIKKRNTTSCAINLDSVHAFFEGKTNTLPEEAMMAVETILRHTPCLRLTPVGRSFFFTPYPNDLKPIGGGKEMWFGYHQSVRIGQWKPFVNLDTSATTFLSKRPVLEYIADAIHVGVEGLRRIPFIDENSIKKINQQLKNKEIRVTHLRYRRRYHIVKLTNVSANDTIIEGKELSVADYFKRQHGVTLKYPNLPCLQVKPEERKIFLPVEVCEFTPGQHYKTELTASEKAKMITFTTILPDDRFREIDCIVKDANFNNDECVREFNFKVSRTPLGLEGRVLQSPNLIYANKKVSPRNGIWDMRDAQFLKGGKISHWKLIAFRNHKNLITFRQFLEDIGEKMGIQINGYLGLEIVDMQTDIKELLKEMKKQADLIVIVLPRHKEEKRIYMSIKRAAETLIGLRTQCIKEERLEILRDKRGPQIIRNLCLKINAKTSGENYTLLEQEMPGILRKPVIIIGADVSHPAPTDTKNGKTHPSIAACVGSLDECCKRFAATVRPQRKTKKDTSRTEEIICDMESMIKELLMAFYSHTNKLKPEKIIIYRDGVSEGEFAEVRKHEVTSVRNACKSMEPDYEPPITFIVVQKRHHIRFKTDDPRDSIKGNVPAGTVADTVVTHKQNYDYYLCSHPGMKGTSRPSYYTVIHDDNDFSANDLEKMTYQFCHMYVRCTKSISIPAPVAYAHLVAYRARKYLSDWIGNNCNTNQNSTDNRQPTLQDIYAKIKVLDDFKDSMYFV